MPYTYSTWGQLNVLLSQRIGDETGAFFTATERGLALQEALRIWGSVTGYWRERGTFATVAGTSAYSLETLLLSSGVALLGQTVTDRDLIQEMQYHLLENATSQSAWLGTDMFTLSDLSIALQRSRDQFLVATGCVLTRSTMNMPPPPTATVELDDLIIDVRRVVWRDVALANHLLWRSDSWEQTSANAEWSYTPGTPQDWLLDDTRPVELRISPPPIDVGTLELVTVNAGAALDPTTSATVMGLPDSLAWAAKWGALADLLTSEGQASDPQRAAFCQQLYDMAVEVANKMPTVIHSEIDGIPGFPCAVADLDAAYTDWQDNSGTPEDVGIIGSNLVYLRDVPDGVYSVVLDVVRNAPIPSNDGEFVQIGREELNAILDLAQIILSFKQGGAEFQDSLSQAQDAFRAMKLYAQRMNANILTLDNLAGLARREDKLRPREMAMEVEVT